MVGGISTDATLAMPDSFESIAIATGQWLVATYEHTVRDPITFFTFVLAFSTIGLWIVTWLSGRRQSREARQTIETMAAAERRQLRAYVGIQRIRFDLPHLSHLNWKAPHPPPTGYFYPDKVLVEVKNFGETPAYEVGVTVYWEALPFGFILPPGFTLPIHAPRITPSNSEVLDKGQKFVATINVLELLPFQAAHARVSSLYVHGDVFYTDVYGRRWRRQYRYVYEPWRREKERFCPDPGGGNDEVYVEQRVPRMPA